MSGPTSEMHHTISHKSADMLEAIDSLTCMHVPAWRLLIYLHGHLSFIIAICTLPFRLLHRWPLPHVSTIEQPLNFPIPEHEPAKMHPICLCTMRSPRRPPHAILLPVPPDVFTPGTPIPSQVFCDLVGMPLISRERLPSLLLHLVRLLPPLSPVRLP